MPHMTSVSKWVLVYLDLLRTDAGGVCPVADDPCGIVAGMQLRRELRRRLHDAATSWPGEWCHCRRTARCCVPGLSGQGPLLLLLHGPPLQRF